MKIEKGIPVPPQRYAKQPLKYPFPDMEIGDSFLAAAATDELRKKEASSIRAQAFRYTNSGNPDFAVTLRIMSNGVRCWRINAKEKKPEPAPPIKVALPPAAGKSGSYVHDTDKGDKPVRVVKGSKY
jgi:hypothetical protein